MGLYTRAASKVSRAPDDLGRGRGMDPDRDVEWAGGMLQSVIK